MTTAEQKLRDRIADLEAELKRARDELAEWRDSPPPDERTKRDLALRVANELVAAYDLERDGEEIAHVMGPILGALDQYAANLRRRISELEARLLDDADDGADVDEAGAS